MRGSTGWRGEGKEKIGRREYKQGTATNRRGRKAMIKGKGEVQNGEEKKEKIGKRKIKTEYSSRYKKKKSMRNESKGESIGTYKYRKTSKTH